MVVLEEKKYCIQPIFVVILESEVFIPYRIGGLQVG